MIESIIFWLIALVTAGSAIFVVTSRNILHAAFSLCFTFLGVGAIYIFLHADFVAAVQLIVYVGGILVLIMFAVMFSSNVVEDTAEHGRSHLAMMAGGTAAVALFAAIVLLTQRMQAPLLAANQFPDVAYAHTVSMIAQEKVPDGWKALAEAKKSEDVGDLLAGFPPEILPPPDRLREAWTRSYSDPSNPNMKVETFFFRFHESGPAGQYGQALISMKAPDGKGVEVVFENERVVASVYSFNNGKTPPEVQFYRTHLSAWMRPVLHQFADVHPTFETGLGHYLMGQYMLPFEVVSVLLLAALIGAVVIVRKELS